MEIIGNKFTIKVRELHFVAPHPRKVLTQSDASTTNTHTMHSTFAELRMCVLGTRTL